MTGGCVSECESAVQHCPLQAWRLKHQEAQSGLVISLSLSAVGMKVSQGFSLAVSSLQSPSAVCCSSNTTTSHSCQTRGGHFGEQPFY